MYQVKTLQKVQKKTKILGFFLDKEVQNLDDHGCLKTRDPFNPKADEEKLICSSYPFKLETTLHCAEGKAELLSSRAMLTLKRTIFCIVHSSVSIYVTKSF